MKASSLNFLVLGDLHFGLFAEHPDFMVEKPSVPHTGPHTVSMKNDFFDKAARLAKIGMLLAPGDLTSIACPAEFELAEQFLVETSERLNLEDKIFHTFGNHDVNWPIAEIASPTSSNSKAILGYKKAGASLGQLLFPLKGMKCNGPLPGVGIIEKEEYQLIILNSSYECHRDQKVKSGKIGEAQRTWLDEQLRKEEFKAKGKWRIVMVHHHPHQLSYPTAWPDYSAIEDGDELLTILGTHGCDFLVHGHRHHPKVETIMKNGWKRPLTVFCAGSFAVDHRHRANGHLDNTFHIVTLENNHDTTNACLGEIRTFFFSLKGWEESSNTSKSEVHNRGALPSPLYFGSIASDAEVEAILENVILTARSDKSSRVGSDFFKLPDITDLPADLKSCGVCKLNEKLETVCQKLKYKILKPFGDGPVIYYNQIPS